MATSHSDTAERSVPRAATPLTAPAPEPPPPPTPTQEELDAMMSGTYVAPPAKAAPKAAAKEAPPWDPPPPATPSQDEVDAMMEGTYPAVPRSSPPTQRDVKPEESGSGYKTR